MAVSVEILAGRFRGCMVGSLLGDCFGAPFEAQARSSQSVLNKYFKKHYDPNLKVPYKKYTDDTAMTRCIAESFITNKSFDATDMARRFVKEYFKDPRRGYGENVVDVFAALRALDFQNPYSPAQLQFGGTGSYGNGGAMRVAPVALFAVLNDLEKVTSLAKNTALITHANRLGYNGAILQCLAVYHALNTPQDQLNPIQFVECLIEDMTRYEPPTKDEIVDGKITLVFVNKLKLVLKLLAKKDEVTRDEVQNILGTDVSAPGSVPTAVYSFLRSNSQVSNVETDNPFQRTVHYAISLGGDTDTIASMAGSIAGAYYGIEYIPHELQKHCEGLNDAIKQADELHQLVT